MSAEILERLAVVENQQANTNQTLNKLADAMTDMTQQVTELAAALKHPDPSHCVQREEIADHEARLRVLESRADKAQGGWSVVHFLLAGGLVSIIGLLSWLVYAFQHFPMVKP